MIQESDATAPSSLSAPVVGELITMLEPGLVRIEKMISNLTDVFAKESEARKQFEKVTSDKSDRQNEMMALLIMSGKGKGNEKRKKGEEMLTIFSEGQVQTVDSKLNEDILNKTAVYVISRSVVDYCVRQKYGVAMIDTPMMLLTFAPHASVRKQAAGTPLGTAF